MSDIVKPYNDQGSKKAQVKEMFDNVAGRYDLLNRLLSMGVDTSWRKRLIREMKTFDPKHILDMATGTADLAVMMAQQLKTTQITGIDLSPNMVTLARQKVIQLGLDDRLEVQVGDSEDIGFEDNSFDAAMVSFGVRNFEDLPKGLAELHRVIKPGTPLMVLEFSKPTIFPIKQVFNLYFRFILPMVGRMLSKDPKAYTYLYESVQVFPDYDDFT